MLGSAGGVGLTAVETGKAIGARVIAGASTAEKLAVARDHRADDLVDYTAEKLTDRVMALTGDKGTDVRFDPIGGELSDAAHRSSRLRSRFVVSVSVNMNALRRRWPRPWSPPSDVVGHYRTLEP